MSQLQWQVAILPLLAPDDSEFACLPHVRRGGAVGGLTLKIVAHKNVLMYSCMPTSLPTHNYTSIVPRRIGHAILHAPQVWTAKIVPMPTRLEFPHYAYSSCDGCQLRNGGRRSGNERLTHPHLHSYTTPTQTTQADTGPPPRRTNSPTGE